MKRYIVDVMKDTDGLFLPMSDEIMKEAGWDFGDEIDFIDNKDGTFTMRKVERPDPVPPTEKYFLIECISQYRTRYVVKARHQSDAESIVKADAATEFSQLHLGEIITATHEITPEHVITLCDQDNGYAHSWSDEVKIETFVTENIYDKTGKIFLDK